MISNSVLQIQDIWYKRRNIGRACPFYTEIMNTWGWHFEYKSAQYFLMNIDLILIEVPLNKTYSEPRQGMSHRSS